jgi:alpha-glucosidase
MKKIVFTLNFILISIISIAQQYEISSPDGKLKVEIEIKEGISARLSKNNITAFFARNIWLETENNGQKFSDFKVKKTIRSSVNETINPAVKEKAAVLNNAYNEIEIKFKDD